MTASRKKVRYCIIRHELEGRGGREGTIKRKKKKKNTSNFLRDIFFNLTTHLRRLPTSAMTPELLYSCRIAEYFSCARVLR